MAQPLVALVAKAPVPGRVKTRCCPPLTPRAAAEVYRGFLFDEVALVGRLRDAAPGIILPPDTDAAALDGLDLAGFWIRRQRVAGLTDALAGTVAEGLARGHDRVIICGTDNPSLPPRILDQAVAALDDHDLVIGPATDGGYYLIGLRRPAPALFENMVWSTPTVFAETLARADQARLRTACLPVWYDVDTADDLRRLAAHLASDPGIVAPATRLALDAAGFLAGA